ncbi:MAG: hypothetical protein F2785_04720 [Actinobacteria bacterium]|uniref:Unannotated protein n=1 Tax=freshwater metagenome TaxID=449393 RepID=A0A6J7DQE5_9ZZZZ|nr:hypothetical protein [Actinomycetota bacterium]
MSAADIDAYLAAVPEPKKSTLEEMRRRILAIVPDAEQKISYQMPAFAVGGKVVAGFAAFKNHLAFLPHSCRVFSQLDRELEGFVRTLSSLHFAIDQPLSEELIATLIEAKMRVLESDGNWKRPE